MTPVGSIMPKTGEKQQANGAGTDGVSKSSEGDEKKDKVDGLAVTELDKKGEKDAGSQKSTEKGAGSSNTVATAVGEPIKVNGSSTTDGVSTDPAAADTTSSEGNTGATHPLGHNNPFTSGSPTKPRVDVFTNADYLKSPQEKAKSPGLLGSFLGKTGF